MGTDFKKKIITTIKNEIKSLKDVEFQKLLSVVILTCVLVSYLLGQLYLFVRFNDFKMLDVYLNIIFYILLISVIIKLISIFSKFFKRKELKNPFLYISFFTCAFIVITGIALIERVYRSPFPYFTAYSSNNNVSLSLYCFSLNGKNVPVYGDFFSCQTIINDDKNMGIKSIDMINYYSIHYPDQKVTDKEFPFSSKDFNNTAIIYPDIRILIENEGSQEFQLTFKFLDKNNHLSLTTSGFIRYEAIGSEAYNNRENTKLSLYITVITLAFFSTFLGIKNIMDIWDRPNLNKRIAM